MTGDKFRFRFAKTGTLRLVSHHDLMRCGERMLRRAALPFKLTAGFHPTPRLVFALSLSLGAIGRDEVVELELTEPRDSGAVLDALRAQAPPGLEFLSATVVPMKATARARRVTYELPIPAARAPQLRAACESLLAEPKVWVERLRPSAKRLNLRPYLRGLRVEAGGSARPTPPGPLPEVRGPVGGESAVAADQHTLTFDLWVTQEGTARTDELLRLLGASDLLAAGAVLERTLIELRDEVPERPAPDVPPDGPSDSIPLTGPEVAALTKRLELEAAEQVAEGSWGASPNGPVVE